MAKAGLPSESKDMKKTGIKGEAIVMKLKNESLYHISWRDNKIVNMLSTIKPVRSSIDRASSSSGGDYVRISIPQPHIIKKYNQGMGGVDLCDQKLSYYRTSVRSKKWTVWLIIHFLYVAINNAHILCSNKNKFVRGNKGFTFLSFIDDLSNELIVKGKELLKENNTEEHKVYRKQSSWQSDPSRLIGYHGP